jgi:hypothetical protein
MSAHQLGMPKPAGSTPGRSPDLFFAASSGVGAYRAFYEDAEANAAP